MNAFLRLAGRDLRRNLAGGGATLPIAFFLLVGSFFPFAVGPDLRLLQATGGGFLWVAALLASLLPVERLMAPDQEAGVLDQLAARGIGEELVIAAKIAAHWLTFGPPLMIAALPAAALLRLDNHALAALELGLLVGTPALAALAVATGAITLGLRGAAALAGLIMLPFAAPILIFGAGALGGGASVALRLLGAVSLVTVAAAPYVAAASLRALRT